MHCRVRLYINVPGSLIINTSSKQPKKPQLSSTKIIPNIEVKQQQIEDSKDNESTSKTIQQTEEVQNEEEEDIDDANQPLLSRDALSETTKDSADTVIVVHKDGSQEPSTSGMNKQNL